MEINTSWITNLTVKIERKTEIIKTRTYTILDNLRMENAIYDGKLTDIQEATSLPHDGMISMFCSLASMVSDRSQTPDHSVPFLSLSFL